MKGFRSTRDVGLGSGRRVLRARYAEIMLPAFEVFNIENPLTHCPIPEGTCLLGYRGSIAHNRRKRAVLAIGGQVGRFDVRRG
jgi:hypothetical protein